MIRILMISLMGLTGLVGCTAVVPDIKVPLGHPANPNSKQGKPIAISRALSESSENDDPFVANQKKNPVPGHSGHEMHKH